MMNIIDKIHKDCEIAIEEYQGLTSVMSEPEVVITLANWRELYREFIEYGWGSSLYRPEKVHRVFGCRVRII